MANVTLNWLAGGETRDRFGNKVINTPYVQSQAATGAIDWNKFYDGMKPWASSLESPAAAPVKASPPMPRPRPWYAPTVIDLAAIKKAENPPFPVNSDIPLNVEAPKQSIVSRIGRAVQRAVSRPATIKGASTGAEYAIGTKAATSQYVYRATESGFVREGASGPGTSAERYAAAVSRNNSGSGTTSSGQSKTASDGSSWAANW